MKPAKTTNKFSKRSSASDHLQAQNQTIEKSNEYNLIVCITIDTVEHISISKAFRKCKINLNMYNLTKYLQPSYSKGPLR